MSLDSPSIEDTLCIIICVKILLQTFLLVFLVIFWNSFFEQFNILIVVIVVDRSLRMKNYKINQIG